MFVGDEINSIPFFFTHDTQIPRAMQFALLRINSIGGFAKNRIAVVKRRDNREKQPHIQAPPRYDAIKSRATLPRQLAANWLSKAEPKLGPPISVTVNT